MMEMKCSRAIAAPPARVFEIVSDLRTAPQRVTGILKMEVLTEGPIRVGTRFRETRKMFGRDATAEMEITRFDPPRSIVRECTESGCHYVMEYRFNPRGTGTEMEMVFHAEPLNFVSKVMGTVMGVLARKTMVKACTQDMDDLARAVESRA